ncbi:polysaccharide deacetylase family protein [Anabaena sp. CA = ATCC 33047]|uniref:polysaccharide deacetylase family protein n=1 Tax=Anabaena sp. (strain CA / ATCC 33047) TaxID=52271 RepID=UPI00082BED4E|nr:polysaccharide deacetylase family protein [Anabaena sp. CA = ATCC 33047]
MTTTKTQNLPFSLALISIISFALLNFEYTEPVVPILGFHGIVDTNMNIKTAEMHYSKQELEKFLEYLIIHDYWFLTTQELYDFFLTKSQPIPGNRKKQKPIMLSFDDGYKSVHTKLLPILYKLENKYKTKVKVVLFINPGHLSNQRDSNATKLGCQDLREGLKAGFYDIQSHGLNHKDVTKLSRRELINELLRARIILRKCTQDLDPNQQVASHFAYPFGATNKQVESSVEKYYLSGYLYNNETLNYNCLKNPYQIPRLVVNRQISATALKQVLEKSYSMKNKQDQKC